MPTQPKKGKHGRHGPILASTPLLARPKRSSREKPQKEPVLDGPKNGEFQCHCNLRHGEPLRLCERRRNERREETGLPPASMDRLMQPTFQKPDRDTTHSHRSQPYHLDIQHLRDYRGFGPPLDDNPKSCTSSRRPLSQVRKSPLPLVDDSLLRRHASLHRDLPLLVTPSTCHRNLLPLIANDLFNYRSPRLHSSSSLDSLDTHPMERSRMQCVSPMHAFTDSQSLFEDDYEDLLEDEMLREMEELALEERLGLQKFHFDDDVEEFLDARMGLF